MDSKKYWTDRYATGGNSGAGSCGLLAEYKAQLLNYFTTETDVASVGDLGCGDGNQASLFTFPKYDGYDISPDAIKVCRGRKIANSKFHVGYPLPGKKFDMAISLDVIYHLVEDDVFEDYMDRLFNMADRFIVIYSSNGDIGVKLAPHLKDRAFTAWVEKNKPEWELIARIENPNKWDGKDGVNKSISDWYIYEKSVNDYE